ncbi:MAG: hypothetical protein ACW972_12510 [Promethearchaeota archaeon]|jgi:hypothetical protein
MSKFKPQKEIQENMEVIGLLIPCLLNESISKITKMEKESRQSILRQMINFSLMDFSSKDNLNGFNQTIFIKKDNLKMIEALAKKHKMTVNNTIRLLLQNAVNKY